MGTGENHRHQVRLYVLIALVSLGAGAALVVPDWYVPQSTASRFWNGLVAFTLLAIASDSSFLRISFANVNSSVGFVPFLAAVPLFGHPWPILVSGITAYVVDTFVRRKPPIRVWFNTAQYMLAVGLGGLVYVALGGEVAVDRFTFSLLPFLGLVLTFFVVNSGSVSLAVAFSSGVSVRESWARITGGALFYDLLASSLAVLLVFLYVKLQVLGLALLLIPLFFVRHIYQMNIQLERVNRELLELMVKAIEARDPYTSGHSRRVAEYAKAVARELGLSMREVDQIETAALMHDVGKIYEEFAPLLRKEGRLTPEERMVMQRHPVRSADLVGTVAELRGPIQAAIRNHHENYDGSGYPDGLTGSEIPIGARIVLIADTLDAMTTDRPYRKALPYARALEELARYAGKQFDPRLVDLVCKSAGIRRLLAPTPVGQPGAISGGVQAAVASRGVRSPVTGAA